MVPTHSCVNSPTLTFSSIPSHTYQNTDPNPNPVLSRMHVVGSPSSSSAAAPSAPQRPPHASPPASASQRSTPHVSPSAGGRGGGGGGGGSGGSGLLSFRMAEELIESVGGRVSVSHQVPMVNALTDRIDSATCIEVLLPAPSV